MFGETAKMTDFLQLTRDIYKAFPRHMAPEAFQKEYADILAAGYNSKEQNFSDSIDTILAYQALPWWVLLEEYKKNLIAHRIENGANFLRGEVWAYYVPVYLLYYSHVAQEKDIDGACGYSEFLQFQFSGDYRKKEFEAFSLPQKKCIATVINSAARDLSPCISCITPACLNHWAQFFDV